MSFWLTRNGDKIQLFLQIKEPFVLFKNVKNSGADRALSYVWNSVVVM